MRLEPTTPQYLRPMLEWLSPLTTVQTVGLSDPPGKFFIVLDEAQAAGELYGSTFCDATGKEDRPVLRPILRFFEKLQFGSFQYILSGTDFSLELFQRVAGSGVGKATPDSWEFFYGYGSFNGRETQETYIRKFLPGPFLDTPSGKLLLERSHRWLRGRHRLTAGFLEALINGRWEGDHPASPHRTFNEYVMNYTGFQPEGDVDHCILDSEPKVDPLRFAGFPLDKISSIPSLLDDLARAVYSYMTQGEWPATSNTWKELITHGIARYREGDCDGLIDEPLALKSLLSWLLKKGKSLQEDIWGHIDRDRGNAWERALVVCLTNLLKKPRRLHDIVQFIFDDRETPLTERTAQVIVGDYNTDIGGPSMWSLEVVLKATSVEMVRDWLQCGTQPWCRPPNAMGPDLLCWLKLDDGSRILLVTQAKCRNDEGNTLPTAKLADGIRSLTPSFFWESISDDKMCKTIKRVLRAIPHSEGKQTRYGILRLIASYPGNVVLTSHAKSLQKALEDKHPLAILRHDRITETFPVFSTSLMAPPISLLSALQQGKPRRTTRDKTSTSASTSFQQIVRTPASEITVSRDSRTTSLSNVTAVKRQNSEHEDGPQPKKARLELAIPVRRSTRQRKLATKTGL